MAAMRGITLRANDNEGVPVLGGDASSDPEVFGVADHGLCSKGPVFFEVLLQPRALVVDRQLRVDTSGDDLGAEPAGGASSDLAVEDQRDLVGPSDVEVVSDDALEERPARGGTVEDRGVGDLELTERQLIAVPGGDIGVGQRAGQPVEPPPIEVADRLRAEAVADPLRGGRVLAG